MEHSGAQHIWVGNPGAADKNLEGLEEVLHVGGSGWALLVAMEAERELYRLGHLVAGGSGQQAS